MQHSENIAKLAAALVLVQREVEHAHKNATNPHFRNRYADLTEVIDTVRPVLAKHGLSVVQFPGYVDGVTTLESVLLHESGEWISGVAGARMQKDDPQGVGSALTYLRRYSLAAVCGISQDDDDGEAASRPKVQPMEIPAREPERSAPTLRKAGVGFDLHAPIGKGAHKSETWLGLAESGEKGREYIAWALGKWTEFTPEARRVLSDLLASYPSGETGLKDESEGVSAEKLQDALNMAAALQAIKPSEAERVEAVIEEADSDHMSAALSWLETQIDKKKIGA